MKKIFVTGSEGFIGSHLVEKLLQNKYKVKALVQYNSFNSLGWINDLSNKDSKNLEIIFGDIRDLSFIDKITKDCDVIFNLAALIGIPYSYHAPTSYYETNVKGTLNILEAAKRNKTKKVIITSTSEVYGTGQYLPIDEKHPLVGQSPYAASKISADQLAMSYFYSFNLPVTIIRPFNTYGPRQSLRAIIPTIIQQMLTNRKTEINLGNINTTRDFSYVSDTVDGFVKSINAKSNGEIINLGSGFEISIQELVKEIGHVLGKKVIVKKDKKRFRPKKSEVERLKSSNTKAKKILKWKPKFVGKKGLREGIKKTLNWFLKNKQLLPNKNSYNI